MFIGLELDLTSNKINFYNNSIDRNYSVELASDLIADLVLRNARRLKALEKPIFLALTGGQDSRLIFAGLVAAKVPFTAFTM